MSKISGPFGGETGEALNAIWVAFESNAEDHGYTGEYKVYNYLEDIPRGSMVKVRAIHE